MTKLFTMNSVLIIPVAYEAGIPVSRVIELAILITIITMVSLGWFTG
jgi:hypothetical protein